MWDYVIITAANERQAAGFREQIKRRVDCGFLNPNAKYAVIPDPPEQRIGNGGSTLAALRYIAADNGSFEGIRSLIILSSGDSKRVPQYSALGKIFSPVPRVLPDGRAATLFDEIILSMESMPDHVGAGAFILSGDVMLSFDANEVTYHGEQAMAMAFPEPVECGADHGVFLAGRDGNIAKVWHKQSPAYLIENGAVDENGCCSIDTGAVFFAPVVQKALYGLICENSICTDASFSKYVNAHIAPSLYVDFFYPLAEDATFEGYLKETPEHLMSEELLAMRREVWDALRPYRIRCLVLKSGRFIHFGSTEEVFRLMSRDIGRYADLGWKKTVNSTVPDGFTGAAWCSDIDRDSVIGRDVYIEKSTLRKCEIGNGSIVSNTVLEGVTVPEHVLLHTMRLFDGKWICKISGISENPKSTIHGHNKGADSTLSFDEISSSKTAAGAGSALSRIEKALEQGIVSPKQLWEPGEKTILWDARVYPVRETQKDAIRDALLFWNKGNIPELPRMSMNESFNLADGLSLI